MPRRARISREALRAVNDDGPEIIDVGEGRPWLQEVAEPGKEFGRIVVIEKVGWIEAELAGAQQRAGVDQGARWVVGLSAAAVGAVGVGGQPGDPGRAGERD